MNPALIEKVVNAVLYEGHILYPYRASSRKNRQRFTFGRVHPRDYSLAQNGAEPCAMQTECLVQTTTPDALVNVTVRFLQPMAREVGRLIEPFENHGTEPRFEIVPELRVNGRHLQTWHEAVERTVSIEPASFFNHGGTEDTEVSRSFMKGSARIPFPNLRDTSVSSVPPLFTSVREFAFPADRVLEPIPGEDGALAGVIVRLQHALAGSIEVSAEKFTDDLFRIRVRILNETPVPTDDLENSDAILMRTFASTHTILHVTGGAFISLLDPPPEHAAAAAACKNIGSWPVLVGDEASGERDAMLSSPIILYDYPQIAPESAGDLFDGTEIDEILTLRVMTMTDDEKSEMRDTDEHSRRILDRTEALTSDDLLKLHGAMRDVRLGAKEFFNGAREQTAVVRGVTLKAGDRVRIRPKNRADVMDIVLAGKIAIIEAVEQDVEDGVHFALVVEDDPGREFGMSRYPGHRFFYTSDEVEPLEAGV